MANTRCKLPVPTGTPGAALPARNPGRRWLVLVPWLIYCAVIFYGSSQSRFFIQPPEFFSSDKVYHFFEYGLLGVLTVRVMGAYRIAPDRPVAWATLFCLLYGISDEFHQWFVPGRFATLGDVLADTLGGWTGARLYTWRTVRPGRRKG